MSGDAPIVTAVIPLFNGERFLRTAVASIARQAQGRVRAVVVDDGSTDSSFALLEALAAEHAWIAPIRHGTNRGVAAARNSGIAAAETPFIAFLDQDDAWAEDKLDRQLAVLAAERELDFVVGRQSFHIEPDVPRPRWVKERYLDGPQPGYVFGTMLAHRHCFARTGPLRESLRYGTDDVDWFARARAAGLRHRMMAETLLDRSLHPANLSRLTEFSNPELLRVMRDEIRRRRAAAGEGGAGTR